MFCGRKKGERARWRWKLYLSRRGIYRAGRRVPVQDISGVFKFNWNMQLTQMDECGKIPHLHFGHIWYWWHRLILNLSVCIILSTFLMYIESMSWIFGSYNTDICMLLHVIPPNFEFRNPSNIWGSSIMKWNVCYCTPL